MPPLIFQQRWIAESGTVGEQLFLVRLYSGILKRQRYCVGLERSALEMFYRRGSGCQQFWQCYDTSLFSLTSIDWSAMKQPCTGNRLEAETGKENADTSALLHVGGLPCSPGATVDFVISVLDSTNVL